MNKQATRFVKLYPLYRGLEADLLFFVAVDTLFLSLTKGFSDAEIVSLTSVSTLSFIILQFPLLWLAHRIGNTGTIRFGAIAMVLSATLITFGQDYLVVAAGKVFHEIAVIFSLTSAVALENCLEIEGREEDFVRVRSNGNTVYAVLTMLISIVAGFMFNLNNHLPMYCCIGAAAIGLILTLFMTDPSPYNKVKKQKQVKKKDKRFSLFRFSSTVLLLILLYGVFYAIVDGSQIDGKLFFQNSLLLDYSKETVTLIISFMLVLSRVSRVIANLVFPAIYKKLGDAVGYLLPAMLAMSPILLLLGSFIPVIPIKIVVMSLGYLFILFVRDPYNIYAQDVALKNTDKEDHQTVITLLAFSTKLVKAATSLSFTFLLLTFPLIYEIIILCAIGVAEIIACYILFRMLASKDKKKQDAISA